MVSANPGTARVLLLLFLALFHCGGRQPDVVVLNEWEYRPGFDLNDPGRAHGEHGAEWQQVLLPLNFSNQPEFKDYKGWIVLRHRLPARLEAGFLQGVPLAVNAGRVLDVSYYYLNANQFGALGSHNPYRSAAMRPFKKDIPLKGSRAAGENYLYIAIYGTGKYPIQIMDRIELGPSDQIYTLHEYREIGVFALLTLYSLAGVYHLLLFLRRPRERYNLLFAGFALATALYWFIANTTLRDLFFADYVEFHRKIEHMVLFTLPPLFIGFITQLFAGRFTRFALVYVIFCVLAIAITGVGPLWLMRLCRDAWYVSLLPVAVYSYYYLIREWRGGSWEALYLFGGLSALLLGVLNDILVSLDLIRTPRIYSFAFLFFVGVMVYVLVRRYLESFIRAEELSNELEQKVIARTEELKASETTLSLLLNKVQGMVYRCRNDHDWTMEFVSSGVGPLLDYTPGDFTSGSVSLGTQVIHADDQDPVWDKVQAALDSRSMFELEYRMHRRSGEIIWVLERGQGIYDDETGELLYLQGFITDVTERKKALETLAQARQESDRARKSVQLLNDFTRNLNESTDLDAVLSRIFQYMIFSFNIDGVWLTLVDSEKNEIRTVHDSFAFVNQIQDEVVLFLRNFSCSLEEENLSFADTVRKRKPRHIHEDSRKKLADTDWRIMDKLNLRGLIQIPLVVQDIVIGVLSVAQIRGERLKLSKSQLASIYNFAEHIGGAVHSSTLLEKVEIERAESDRLLLNVLPELVADELKKKGKVQPLRHESVTVLFTDFVGFTKIAESLPPDRLLEELDGCFTQFDEVIAHHGLEKLKTIGDAYMCCGGLPLENNTHMVDACLAALEFQAFMNQMREIKSNIGLPFWELRLGLHTGPVMAGVVGKNKFAYDIWGDTVNTASRMESSGAPGRVNISGGTYELVKYFFQCEYRGRVMAKGKGEMDMYFLNGIRPRLARDAEGRVPNDDFYHLYEKLKSGARLRFREEVRSAAE